ncbi:MAG: conjugal transfer protein TrbE, partial [Boseongicola sp.]|nr:conjugal transfer protein TrbE [Boseongicola sp.]
GRKLNVAVLMATQSVADAARSELTEDLLESCPTKLFLPNPGAETRAARQHYDALGLDPAQVGLVARIAPKRELYLVQPGGRRVISLPMGPAALSILGRTGADDSARALKLRPGNPEYWKEDFENDTGIDLDRAQDAA